MVKPVANYRASESSKHVPQTGRAIGKKPVLTNAAKPGQPRNWSFSFRFWRQIDHFGLGGKDPGWFVSLIQRLQQVCCESIDVFRADSYKQNSFRYHKVNWGQCNIPIQRKDLGWLPKDYLDNDAEYPIYQFSISTGVGRVAGFWDENDVFNIILIDPFHNLQPSKRFDYRLTPTAQLPGEHELLLAQLSQIKRSKPACSHDQCSTQSALEHIGDTYESFGILCIDGEYFDQAKELVRDGTARSVAHLLELGILTALQPPSSTSEKRS
jgi:hypothetical protein